MCARLETALEVHDLRFRYAGSERWTLDGIYLQIAAGECLLLLGASGSGKSTLALALTGLIPQRIEGELTGTVTIAGYDSATTPLATLCTHVGMVMQDPSSQMVMPRVEDEIAFGLENLAVEPCEIARRVEQTLAQTGLTGLRHASLATLSGGQQQRVALAAVLALRPQILILDEPTASLDPAGAASFFATLAAWRRATGATLVIIEHRLDLVMPLVDRVVALNGAGKILAQGTPDTFFQSNAVRLVEEGIVMPASVRRHLPTTAAIPDAIATAGTPLAIHLEQLRFHYPRGPEVLRGINLQVKQGDFLALIGSNGSGKSTLARHLVGLLTPQGGSLHILGQRIHRRNTRHLAQQVGYVFQNPEHQFVTERVADEIAFSMRGRWDEQEITARVDHLLAQFNLAAHADANPFRLSWGQKRRLSVATMVALDQRILILDEPTLGQDARNMAILLALLQQLNAQGTTIVVITHDMEFVAAAARTVAVLHQGELLFSGAVDELFARPELLVAAQLATHPAPEAEKSILRR